MPNVGADASAPVTTALLNTATTVLREKPQFMGRYFKNPQSPDTIQYQPDDENNVLRTAGIPILCLARQTARVGGSQLQGATDAVWNMAAIIEAFGLKYLHGLGYDPLIFLDTEPPPDNPALNADYYYGWANALRNYGEYVPVPQPAFTVRFTPALYINQGDVAAWKALASAMQQGAECQGAWVAHYDNRTGDEGPPAWTPAEVNPPAPLTPPCPIIAWQYVGDYKKGPLDFTVLEPTRAAATLRLTIPAPPPPAVA
jgi:hypothetical protein